jgi:hypothetical protein
MRTFESGATRDNTEHKNDYEGFLSPLVIRAYGDYMQKHRVQADGSIRDSDNWQRGMGLHVMIKSLWRHFMDLWAIHRGYKTLDFDGKEVIIEDALCGILFNTMGYFHELLSKRIAQENFEMISYLMSKKSNVSMLEKDYLVGEEPHCVKCLMPKSLCICGY